MAERPPQAKAREVKVSVCVCVCVCVLVCVCVCAPKKQKAPKNFTFKMAKMRIMYIVFFVFLS